MMCEVCGLREADHLLVEVVGGEKHKKHVCQNCAFRLAVAVPEEKPLEMVSYPASEKREEQSGRPPERMDLTCPRCGRSYIDVKKTFLLGCAECYYTFVENIPRLIEKFHGAAHLRYRGVPYTHDPKRRALMEERTRLLAALEEAVAEEQFEKAAKIRDRIRQIEKELGWTSSTS